MKKKTEEEEKEEKKRSKYSQKDLKIATNQQLELQSVGGE